MDAATSLFGQAGTLGISAINTEEQYLAALVRITELCDVEPYYPECNELEFLGMLVEVYEEQLLQQSVIFLEPFHLHRLFIGAGVIGGREDMLCLGNLYDEIAADAVGQIIPGREMMLQCLETGIALGVIHGTTLDSTVVFTHTLHQNAYDPLANTRYDGRQPLVRRRIPIFWVSAAP